MDTTLKMVVIATVWFCLGYILGCLRNCCKLDKPTQEDSHENTEKTGDI